MSSHSPAAEAAARPTLAQTLDDLTAVQGWMTDGQAGRLWAAAARLQPGDVVVEIGSFHGRSTVVLARSAPDGCDVVAIDPHAGGDRGPQEIAEDHERGDADLTAFRRTLQDAGVADRVRHVRLPSSDAHGEVTTPIDLLYVDGAHRYGPALADIESWGGRVRPGGTMLVHDSFSSLGVTLALLRTTAGGSRWRYVGRERTLAEFRREDLAGAARRRNAARQIRELGWFARNLAIKVAIVVHAKGLARRLGDGSGEWPY